jgi:hypothetical protein
MGNTTSKYNHYTIENNSIQNNCLICLENVNINFCICIRCNIKLHILCEQQYRSDKKYTECPHCRRIGTIGYYI